MNLVAITAYTVCVGSVVLLLVSSTSRRIVDKMFWSLCDNSVYVTVITIVLISLKSYYVALLNFQFLDFTFLFLLFVNFSV